MTNYIGFGNDTLDKLPLVHEGDLITCSRCNGIHKLEVGKDENGQKSELILFFYCGKNMYLGAVNNHCVSGVKPDCSGKISL